MDDLYTYTSAYRNITRENIYTKINNRVKKRVHSEFVYIVRSCKSLHAYTLMYTFGLYT